MDLPNQRFCRTPTDFEDAAADWLRYFGFQNVVRTPVGPDGGADVHATGAIAQVKAHQTPVGRPDVQQLRGVAHRGEIAIFFSLNDYTLGARQYADDAAVALFRFAGYDGSAEPCNQHAQQLLLRIPEFRAARETAEAQQRAAQEAAQRAQAERDALLRLPRLPAAGTNRIGFGPLSSLFFLLVAYPVPIGIAIAGAIAGAVPALRYSSQAFMRAAGFVAWPGERTLIRTGSQVRGLPGWSVAVWAVVATCGIIYLLGVGLLFAITIIGIPVTRRCWATCKLVAEPIAWSEFKA